MAIKQSKEEKIMASINLDPYIFFNGNAKEAMNFYKSIFGGELTVSTFGDTGADKAPGMEAMKDYVMHAMLAGDVRIMASDSRQASEKAAKIELSLSGDDEAKLTSYFEKLSEGGKVKSPLKKEMWGDTFGQLTDKYNIDWMVNISAPKQ
jgi:PhnB protein